MKLIFVTGNKNKLAEAAKILQKHELINEPLDIPELQGTSKEIVFSKARLAYQKFKKPCFVDDTSLCFNAWNGLPGPYIKDFLRFVGIEKLPSLLVGQDKSGYVLCSIGYAKSEDEIFCFEGRINGKIVPVGGDSGFQFDRIFIPLGYDKRFSEMTMEEKNKISHRKKAFEHFNAFLECQ